MRKIPVKGRLEVFAAERIKVGAREYDLKKTELRNNLKIKASNSCKQQDDLLNETF